MKPHIIKATRDSMHNRLLALALALALALEVAIGMTVLCVDKREY